MGVFMHEFLVRVNPKRPDSLQLVYIGRDARMILQHAT
jgi:hypothetical protein